MTLDISHVSFSESGGAGLAAKSLAIEQSKLGHKVEILTATDGALASQLIVNPLLVAQGAMDYFLVRNKSDSALFSLFRTKSNQKIKSSIKPRGILNIHWPVGILSSQDIHALSQSRRVFWTLHDTWAFTGGCHYDQGCKKFESDCNGCPQAKKVFSKKISNNKLNKNKYFRENKNLIIITPSAWLKSMAIKSNTFYEPNIYHIPNGINHTVFKPITNMKKTTSSEITLGLCAVDLLDSRKNIRRALNWLKEIANENIKLKILLQGKNAETFKESLQFFRVETRGYNREEMPIFYNELDYFVNFSLAENLPTTVLEAQACGIPVIVNSIGGSSEMIEVGRNGFIANDLEQLRHVLDEQSGRDDIQSLKENSRSLSLEKYDIQSVAAKYIDLYVTNN